jgi:hypothetical protein
MRSSSIALAALTLVACSSPREVVPDIADASTEDAADDASNDAACELIAPYSSKNVTCNGCAQARCCAAVNGCLGDARCNDDYVNCILACALLPEDAGADAAGVEADCVGQCGGDFPAGKAEYDAAVGCVDAQCAVECQ